MPISFGHSIIDEWLLDKRINFLNNGSFGSTPRVVIEEFERINRLIETEPLEFFLRQYYPLVRKSAIKLAHFIGVNANNLVFVENATAGVNTVLHSLTTILNPGDEIIYTNQVYPAVLNAIHYVCLITGCKVNQVNIPYPIEDKSLILELIKAKLNSRTKIAVIDHIASATSIIFPIKEIISICKANNTLLLVDGAHSPGMLNLNLSDLEVDFYVGNCHKWLFTPKGTALFFCRKELQELIHPLVISLDYGKGFIKEFDWIGTRNPSSWLSVSKALDFYYSLGKREIINYIHNLAIEASKMIIEELKIDMHLNEELYGAMVSFPIRKNDKITNLNTLEIRNLFYDKYKIEIPFFIFNNELLFRISAQVYNELTDYEKLITPLKTEFFN